MTNNPKFINMPQAKISYSFRINEDIINKLHELANLTDIKTAELLNEIINDYLKDKTIYNSYLENYKNYFMEIPINLFFKKQLTNNKKINLIESLGSIKHKDYYLKLLANENEGATVENIEKITQLFKIYRIPNNLDNFNKSFRSYAKDNNINNHSGIEFFINPAIAKELKENFINCLYCFYFEIKEKDIIINLISFNNAIALLNAAGNNEILAIANKIYNELEKANNYNDVLELANMWNSGNIIKLADDDIKEKVSPFKIEITRDNTIIKQYDKKLYDNLENLTLQVKEQTAINKVLANELENLKAENNELKENNKILNNNINTAVAKALKDFEEKERAKNKKIITDLLKEYNINFE